MEMHCCKFCGRCFPSGRSLGGHMRSHVVRGSSLKYAEKTVSSYGLRENPRKSWRFDEAWTKMEKQCCELEVEGKELEDSWSTEVEDDEEHEMEIQTDGEALRRRPQRRRLKRLETISDSSSPSPSSPEYGALCLMLLSRGASSVSDSSDVLNRYESDFLKIGLKKDEFFPSQSGFPIDGDDEESKKGMEFTVFESGKMNKSSRSDFDSGTENSCKRSRYECTICNRSFDSYQALGGHCASHKKNRADLSSVSPAAKGTISGRFRAHRCLICGKVFASGQALGGHRRSHLISENASSSSSAAASAAFTEVIEIGHKNPKKNSLDLNLPAPGFGVRDSFDSNESSDEIKFTAFEKNCRLQAFMI